MLLFPINLQSWGDSTPPPSLFYTTDPQGQTCMTWKLDIKDVAHLEKVNSPWTCQILSLETAIQICTTTSMEKMQIGSGACRSRGCARCHIETVGNCMAYPCKFALRSSLVANRSSFFEDFRTFCSRSVSFVAKTLLKGLSA